MRYLTLNGEQQLHFAEIAKPILAADECLIKVRAIGINRADILQKQGKYPPPAGESEILGIEACGDIVAIADESACCQYSLGDRVFAIVPGGAYAEYVKVKISHLFKLPKHFSYAQGAAIAETFLTAFQCLFKIANLKSQSRVLIHAGASGVGCAAIQLAKSRNCYVVATAGSSDKVNACKTLGADEALNYHQVDFMAWAKQHKQSFDVIIDVVAGDYVNKNINVCALDGHIVMLSMLGGRYAKELDMAKMLLKRITISASTLRNRNDIYKTELVNDFNKQFYSLLISKEIIPVIHQEFSWQDVERAHQVINSNENIGKLILLTEQ